MCPHRHNPSAHVSIYLQVRVVSAQTDASTHLRGCEYLSASTGGVCVGRECVRMDANAHLQSVTDTTHSYRRKALSTRMWNFIRKDCLSICWGPQLELLRAPINYFQMKFRRHDLYKYVFYICFIFVSFNFIHFEPKSST
jgi:hypothetical protein